MAQRRLAFARGLESINQQGAIPTIDTELLHFTGFYEIVFSHLPGLAVDSGHVAAIAEDLMLNPEPNCGRSTSSRSSRTPGRRWNG